MNYSPTENPHLHEVVVQLYRGEWEDSVRIAQTLVASTEAAAFVKELTRSTGWRERVAAAKIVHAYKLHELVEPLVETFSANPETYTARAFAKLVAKLEIAEKEVLLSRLQDACSRDSYGRHLLETIKTASASEPAA